MRDFFELKRLNPHYALGIGFWLQNTIKSSAPRLFFIESVVTPTVKLKIGGRA